MLMVNRSGSNSLEIHVKEESWPGLYAYTKALYGHYYRCIMGPFQQLNIRLTSDESLKRRLDDIQM